MTLTVKPKSKVKAISTSYVGKHRPRYAGQSRTMVGYGMNYMRLHHGVPRRRKTTYSN